MNKNKHTIEVESREEDPAQAEARRRTWQLEDEQHELLLDLVDSETLPTYAVVTMIELGMITLQADPLHPDDPLPCDYLGRSKHWCTHDEELKLYLERKRNPGPPPEGPEPGVADIDKWDAWAKQWHEYHNYPPDPAKVGCPLLAMAWEGESPPVPCVTARASQRDSWSYKDNPEKCRALDDPEDPVNKLQLRPCVALGRALSDGIFVTLARRRQEAAARRWPEGKPKA